LLATNFNDIREAIEAYEVQMRARSAEAARASLDNTAWMHTENAMDLMLGMFKQ
jgi:hypothetical protein